MLGLEPSRLGVDLGTTHTVAALAVHGARVQQLLFDSSPLLSSAVYAEAGRSPVAGRDAERAARIDPTRFEPNPKRRIDDGSVLLGDQEYKVADLLAAILRRVADEAGRVGGGSPGATVLTYPANWATTRRGLLADAAQRAGLRSLTLVPEPIAAAAYFTTVLGRPVPPGAGLVVYDLGAGTFDTSVLRRRPDQGWEVLASEGVDVGGLDLDAEIVELVGEAMSARDAAQWARLRDSGEEGVRRMRRALWDDARAAKEQLSRAPSAAVQVPLFDTHAHVTREQFEARARPWLARTVELTAVALGRAGLAPGQIAGLFLVGGSSRIPLVGTMLHQRLGVAPTVIEQPELVVALGSLAAAPAGQRAAAPIPAPPPYAVPPPVAPASGAPAPTPMSPAAAAPVSGTPLAGTPVSGVPVSGSPTSAPPGGPSPTSGPPMPLWPDPVAAAQAPATPRPRKRTGLVLAAAAAAVLLVSVGGVTSYNLLSDDSGRDRSAGNSNGGNPSGGNPSIAVGGKPQEAAEPGADQQTAKIDKTIWYGGRKVSFGEATYDSTKDPPLTVTAAMENLTDRSVYAGIDMALSLDGQSYQGTVESSGPVPANAKSNVVFGFGLEQAPSRLADSVLTVGGGGELKAVVPFREGGAFEPLEPKAVVTNKPVKAGALSMTAKTCEVRGDNLKTGYQVKEDQRFLACVVDIKYHGASGRPGGQNIDDTNFRLRLPDKSTVEAPTDAPIDLLNPNEVGKDQYLVFTLTWPAPGDYAVQLLDLGWLNNDSPSPARTGNIAFTIPES
ncbi:Hsp70 family protein [Phytohabitans sp. LJ34]|uniref:Hsp70 family protein n=1 Tax=Phytohabitans sp. LJ34 TaxID=3452217 RepID=UPI003F8BBEE2